MLLGQAPVLAFMIPMFGAAFYPIAAGVRSRRISKIEFNYENVLFTTLSGKEVVVSLEHLRSNSGVGWNGFYVRYGESLVSCYSDSFPKTPVVEEFLRLIGVPKVDRFEKIWILLFPVMYSCIPLGFLGVVAWESTTDFYKGALSTPELIAVGLLLSSITFANAVWATQLMKKAPTWKFIFASRNRDQWSRM